MLLCDDTVIERSNETTKAESDNGNASIRGIIPNACQCECSTYYKLCTEIQNQVRINTGKISELAKLKDQVKLNGSNTANNVQAKITPKSVPNTRNQIYVFGDSLVRYAKSQLIQQLPDKQETVQLKFGSGYTYSQVKQLLTAQKDRIQRSDTLILVAGTNDLFKTKWSALKESIQEVCLTFSCKIIVVLIPCVTKQWKERQCIKRLNGKILKEYSKYQHVTVLDPNLVLIKEHFAQDKIHFNVKGCQVLCQELVKCMFDKSTITREYNIQTSSGSKTKQKKSATDGTSSQYYENRNKIRNNKTSKKTQKMQKETTERKRTGHN
uniref:Uncharacterized protein n=1 Tax=Cacopsylla melanoneura TaxID=428564 RepID=A0A8D9E9X4_9HEMI